MSNLLMDLFGPHFKPRFNIVVSLCVWLTSLKLYIPPNPLPPFFFFFGVLRQALHPRDLLSLNPVVHGLSPNGIVLSTVAPCDRALTGVCVGGLPLRGGYPRPLLPKKERGGGNSFLS